MLSASLLLVLTGGLEATESKPVESLPGFSYIHEVVRDGPWSIHVVKVARANPEYQLHSTMGYGNRIGLTLLTDQLRLWPDEFGQPLAAINGDYYDSEEPYEGDPKGLQICRGELVSAPQDWSCLWVDAAGRPHMNIVTSHLAVIWPNGARTPMGLNERRPPDGAVLYTPAVGSSTHARGGRELVLEKSSDGEWLPLRAGREYKVKVKEVRPIGNTRLTPDSLVLSLGPNLLADLPEIEAGTELRLSTATTPDLKGCVTALSGGPALVRDGKALSVSSFFRHPRAAVGWNKEYIYFVEVDGRQLSVSIGMTTSELAAYMVKLGCEEALNLDGGGSATLWVQGHVRNHPSEGQPREVGNGLIIVQKPKTGGPLLTGAAGQGR